MGRCKVLFNCPLLKLIISLPWNSRETGYRCCECAAYIGRKSISSFSLYLGDSKEGRQTSWSFSTLYFFLALVFLSLKECRYYFRRKEPVVYQLTEWYKVLQMLVVNTACYTRKCGRTFLSLPLPSLLDMGYFHCFVCWCISCSTLCFP